MFLLGLYTRLEEDTAFDERVSLLRSVLEQRTSEYEAEEKMLQVNEWENNGK